MLESLLDLIPPSPVKVSLARCHLERCFWPWLLPCSTISNLKIISTDANLAQFIEFASGVTRAMNISINVSCLERPEDRAILEAFKELIPWQRKLMGLPPITLEITARGG